MSKKIKTRLRRIVAERRQARRHKAARSVRLLVGVASETEVGGEPVTGRTRDLSETGISISLPALNPDRPDFADVGSTVRVLLALPTATVGMYADVVRGEQLDEKDAGKGRLIAVRITRISAGDEARYKEYLRTLS